MSRPWGLALVCAVMALGVGCGSDEGDETEAGTTGGTETPDPDCTESFQTLCEKLYDCGNGEAASAIGATGRDQCAAAAASNCSPDTDNSADPPASDGSDGADASDGSEGADGPDGGDGSDGADATDGADAGPDGTDEECSPDEPPTAAEIQACKDQIEKATCDELKGSDAFEAFLGTGACAQVQNKSECAP